MIAYYAGIVSLIGGILILLAFIFVLANRFPKENTAQVVSNIYKIRVKYFYILTILVVVATYLALKNTIYPYMRNNEKIDTHVTVIAQKWLWHLHNGKYSDDFLESSVNESIILQKNKNIEFHVSASDVNHGLGIYTSSGVLLSQTQAMPGHVYRLLVNFKKPGIYKILCMEYCGVGHHVMQESLVVK